MATQSTGFPRGTVWFAVLATTSSVAMGIVLTCCRWGPSVETLAAGRILFQHEYRAFDPLCGDGDGLGPVFNERSCVACHFQGGAGGSGSNEFNVTAFEAFPVPGRAEIVSGGIHAFATLPRFEESTAIVQRLFPAIPGAVRTVDGCSTRTSEFDPVQIDQINTPALFGIGELEKISSAAITMHGARRSIGKVSKEFGGDFGGSGIGRVRVTGDHRVGKFGWKGQFSTVAQFVANACAMELGLTNPAVAQPMPNRFEEDESADLDMTKKQLYQLVSFVKSFPRPQRVMPTDPQRRRAAELGEQLFNKIGCADCHVPNLGGVEGVYSDFHLYEVEHEDGENDYVQPDFDPAFTLPFDHPRPSEWKTPPLWGVADSAPYFHDGQSPTLVEAIRRHGRDGAFARDNFASLSSRERFAILEFLKTLRAPGGASKPR